MGGFYPGPGGSVQRGAQPNAAVPAGAGADPNDPRNMGVGTRQGGLGATAAAPATDPWTSMFGAMGIDSGGFVGGTPETQFGPLSGFSQRYAYDQLPDIWANPMSIVPQLGINPSSPGYSLLEGAVNPGSLPFLQFFGLGQNEISTPGGYTNYLADMYRGLSTPGQAPDVVGMLNQLLGGGGSNTLMGQALANGTPSQRADNFIKMLSAVAQFLPPQIGELLVGLAGKAANQYIGVPIGANGQSPAGEFPSYVNQRMFGGF